VTKRGRTGRSAVALVLAFGLIAAACGGSDNGKKTPGTAGVTGNTEDATTKPTPGGSLTMGLEAETTGGWCLSESQLAIAGIQVARAIYDYLVVPDEKGNYVPFLADKITGNTDATVWTIHLRSGIKFHDGTALTSTVVKNNIDAYRGSYPKRSPLLFIFEFKAFIKSTKVVDPLTVEVDTVPWAAFPSHLYGYGRVGIIAQKQLDDGKNCFKDMIGTGPFMFKGDWQVGDHLTVVKNPNYWRKDKFGQQLPYLDKLTFKPYVEPTTEVNAINSKALDLAHTDVATSIAKLQTSAKAGSINLTESDKFPEVTYNLFNESKPPFDNMNARFAFAYAIDQEAFNRVRRKGLLKKATGPFGPGVLGYLADPGLIKYDPTKARQYVAKYTQQTGKKLEFTLGATNDTDGQQDIQFEQSYLQKVGMIVHLKQTEQSQYINDAIGGNYQVQGWRNHPGFDPDDQYVWWHCDNTPPAPCDNPVNFSHFNDPVINKALADGRASTDTAVRKTAYEDINKSFAKNLWEAWGFYALWTIPAQKDVKGIWGPDLPTDTSPDAKGAKPFTGLSSGVDVSGLWKGSAS
jgi:peptide/nickel transport system substrate-binding protein